MRVVVQRALAVIHHNRCMMPQVLLSILSADISTGSTVTVSTITLRIQAPYRLGELTWCK